MQILRARACCDNDAIWSKDISLVNPMLLLDQIIAHNG